jgi:Holliday junction resolvase
MSFQRKVIKRYEAKGYLVLKIIRLNKAGYPDLLCLKDGKAVFIEVKENKDTLKPLQQLRIDELIELGFESFCLKDE